MDSVSEVKARLGIEDVVSEYVQLKRAGRNYKGLSPFSNEKTPSFVVSPEKQIWHDFSSGRGGDMFTFIEEIEGLDFKGALELLARKAGVDLEKFKSTSGVDKNRLYEALELAAKFYQSQLSIKPEAAEYILRKRKFSKQTALEFQLGYSPSNRSSLADFLIKKGFNKTELKNAGLINSSSSLSDMFRGRIMIPLHDSFGRVIGFTARLLSPDDNGPKYINTPSTPLYDKSRHVYGLHLAKKSIRDNKFSVIVEGNLDVISSHQAGQRQVVATAGTALTDQQLKALSNFSPDVRLAFDQDRAGLEAAERAIPIASKGGVNLSIITVPEGKDPDELINIDPKLWEKAIANADYAVDWVINRYKENLDLSSAQGKRKFSDVTLEIIKKLEDPVEQDHYLGLISDISGIDSDALRRKLANIENQTASKRLKQVNVKVANKKIDHNRLSAINKLFSLCLMMPGTRVYLDLIESKMLLTEDQQKFYEFISKNQDFDGNLKEATELKEVADYVKILSLLFEELYASVDTLELQYEAERLRATTIEYFIQEQKISLSNQLKLGDSDKELETLSKVRDLDQLLQKIKKS